MANIKLTMRQTSNYPKITARLAELGSSAFPSSFVEFSKFIAEETRKSGKIVKFSDVKPQ